MAIFSLFWPLRISPYAHLLFLPALTKRADALLYVAGFPVTFPLLLLRKRYPNDERTKNEKNGKLSRTHTETGKGQ